MLEDEETKSAISNRDNIRGKGIRGVPVGADVRAALFVSANSWADHRAFASLADLGRWPSSARHFFIGQPSRRRHSFIDHNGPFIFR
jgi:hypothetical protein